MYHCYRTGKANCLLMTGILLGCILLTGSLISRPVSGNCQEGIFLPVIMYHSVTAHPQTDYQISPEMFAEDLYYLYANGYHTVSAEQLRAYTEHRGTLPEKPVMLTFDDGFYNNLSTALPLLEEYDMCAVISIVGYYTDVTAEKDPHVDRYSYLTWGDVQELLDSGRIEIGSHTYNLHSNAERAGCSIRYGEDEENYTSMLREDLGKLQTDMQEHTGRISGIFAYPYGFICRESVPVLKEMGFFCTLICREEGNYITQNPECLYGLSRYNRNPAESTGVFFSRILQENS